MKQLFSETAALHDGSRLVPECRMALLVDKGKMKK